MGDTEGNRFPLSYQRIPYYFDETDSLLCLPAGHIMVVADDSQPTEPGFGLPSVGLLWVDTSRLLERTLDHDWSGDIREGMGPRYGPSGIVHVDYPLSLHYPKPTATPGGLVGGGGKQARGWSLFTVNTTGKISAPTRGSCSVKSSLTSITGWRNISSGWLAGYTVRPSDKISPVVKQATVYWMVC